MRKNKVGIDQHTRDTATITDTKGEISLFVYLPSLQTKPITFSYLIKVRRRTYSYSAPQNAK